MTNEVTSQKHKMSKRYLKRLITSRSEQLNCTGFQDLKAMESYADNAFSSVYLLLLEAAGIKNVDCDHAASHLGKAQGLSNLIRAIPFNVQRKITMLPQSELVKYNVSEESVFRGQFNDEFREVIYTIASSANQHLTKARSLNKNFPDAAKKIFLPAVPTDIYLTRLRINGFNVFESSLAVKAHSLPFSLFWHKFRKRF